MRLGQDKQVLFHTGELFDPDGTLVGWMRPVNVKGGQTVVFIPRKERHVEEDRALIKALMQRIRKPIP